MRLYEGNTTCNTQSTINCSTTLSCLCPCDATSDAACRTVPTRQSPRHPLPCLCNHDPIAHQLEALNASPWISVVIYRLL
ncbi:hypothetical protein HBI56_037800 [Parastagonospora nodorum]|uniref:Uncharacterized protein n=1 Tax=Phaeosphaeria nodorum (strain SN15 / ATCC MYA-4574 / FGSC 10173) TaxID=321614 RepID=A0A7U2HZ91_PHANO|nr:hypothetical protein HBH56_069000 [Parastagonospora nodorum]QRC93552.1 hypothetical protein JI435_404050 [Parastagonospora nodorum SN15]KAH3932798.1 hypothetical protein HBH54_079120 [Parastagonospora nodorum]KAH3955042.1 hypothetical protein HBH53_015240 [Parastagonospora nodorum]KAH3986101.1 hypothetical protein HBH52_046400 [Parastagonospora nodorum]